MQHRAYTTLDIRAVSDAPGKRRTFSGIATTPSTDRMGDIIESEGAQFKLPLPLLWQHDSRDPIGWITAARVTPKGIEIDGEVADIPEPGPLKERLATAWQMLKAKLVRGLSIGFNSLDSSEIKGTYGLRFTKWEWLELSAVTIPANQDASIQQIKSIDIALQRAASGQQRRSAPPNGPPPPGVSGTPKQPASSGFFVARNQEPPTMKTLQDLRADRLLKTQRMTELVDTAKAAGLDMSAEESAEFDALEADIVALDGEIRTKRLEAVNAASATPVAGHSRAAGSQSRGPTIIVNKQDPDDKFKGQSYTRLLIAKAAAFVAQREGNFVSPVDVAVHRWGKSHPKLVEHIRAAVAGGGTGSGEWGAELAQSDARFSGDFIEFLYSKTVFDSLPLRSVPARVHIKGQDGAATGYWVGESKAISVSKPDFSTVELTPLKVAAMAVCSKELLRDSSPAAEMLIRDSIVEASAQRVDTTFLSTTAASSGVSPAGLLNGLSALAPSGTDAAAIRADYQWLVQPFISAKNASGLVHVMTPSMAMAISMLVNALGQTEFPDIMENGGTLFKRPVYTGDNVTPGDWLVLKPSDIWKIGDGGVQVSMSDQATIEQNDAPQGAGDTPTAASATLMSLWQTEQIGFKVVRSINYAKRRSGAVVVLSNAEYGGVIS